MHRKCAGQQLWYCIPNLAETLAHVPRKTERIGKELQARRFTPRNHPCLGIVIVDTRVGILREMCRNDL
jgi:hypothetical protein